MKRDFINTFIIALFSISLMFSGCNMQEIFNEHELESKNKVSEISNNPEKTKVSFTVSDYNGEIPSARSVLPVSVSASEIVKYQIAGINNKNSELFNESWSSYSELQQAVMELIPATWTFTVSAYKRDAGGDLIKVASCEKEITLVYGVTNTVQFELGSADGNGSFSVVVEYPSGGASAVSAKLKKLSGSSFVDVKDADVSLPVSGTATDSVICSAENIAAGYYYLFVEFKTGALVTATKVIFIQIAGGLKSSGSQKYASVNTPYAIIYNLPSGASLAAGAVDSFNDSDDVTLPVAADLTYNHYKLEGWYTNSELSGEKVTGWNAGTRKQTITLYPKWIGADYNVIYKDFAGGQLNGKEFSGDTTLLPSSLQWEASNNLGTPVFSEILSDDNAVVFEGWYKDSGCTQKILNNITDVTDLTIDASENVTVYAKWNYKYVYVDPSSSFSGTSNTNRGFSPMEPLLTVTEAKNYLAGNNKAETLYLCSTLIYSSATGDVNDLSGISNTSTYGDGIKPVIVKRHSLNTGIMVKVPVAGLTVSDLILDGGAVWGSGGAAGINGVKSNTGLSADDVLINVSSPGADVTLNHNVILQNNDCSGTGSAVYVSGRLNSYSDTNKIIRCRSESDGCAVYQEYNSIVNFVKGIIGGNSSDGNYGAGAAVYNYDGELYLGDVLNNADGSECVISNNFNISDTIGGAVFISSNGISVINRTQIKENKTLADGGGLYLDPRATVNMINSYVQGNSSGLSGGGIYIAADDSTNLTLENCSVTDNVAAVSGGGIYSSGKLVLKEKTDITKNHLSDNLTVSNLFYNYDPGYPARLIEINTNLTPSAEQPYVTTISIPDIYYPADESSSVLIFDETTSGLIASNYQLFACEKRGYKINSSGCIYCYPIPSSGDIGNPLADILTFAPSDTTFTYAAGSSNAGNLVFTSYVNGTAADVTDWSIEMKVFGLIDVTGLVITSPNDSSRSVAVTSDVLPAGTYTVKVSAKYNGIKHSDTFNIIIN